MAENSQVPPPEEQMFADYSAALATAIDGVLVEWVVNSVTKRASAAAVQLDEAQLAAAVDAGELCRADVSAKMWALLQSDLDVQQSTPLALLRSSTSYATQVLMSAGVPQVQRDEFEQRAFPEDVYGLAPAALSDVNQLLLEPGLEWGAAKAHLHLLRRRAAGQR
ncbi:MAG: hypothetical protein WCJ04_08465 [Actinomycetes bacterium]